MLRTYIRQFPVFIQDPKVFKSICPKIKVKFPEKSLLNFKLETFGFLAILSSICKPAFSGCTVFLYLVVLKNKIKDYHGNETGASKELSSTSNIVTADLRAKDFLALYCLQLTTLANYHRCDTAITILRTFQVFL